MTQSTHSIAKQSKKSVSYILFVIIIIGAVSFGVASFASANASSAHNHSTKAQSTYSKPTDSSKPKPATGAATTLDKTSDSSASPTVTLPSTSANNIALNSSTIASKTPTVKTNSLTPAVSPAALTPPAAAVSSDGGVYDGYGYHVQDTQITETISRASAQACAGYLCGSLGPTISYNLSSPAAGSFQFVESRSDNVEFYIYSGGLSKGDSPAFSPISINPNVPNGTYTGSIQLQFDIDTNDDYANGPVIDYSVDLTN